MSIQNLNFRSDIQAKVQFRTKIKNFSAFGQYKLIRPRLQKLQFIKPWSLFKRALQIQRPFLKTCFWSASKVVQFTYWKGSNTYFLSKRAQDINWFSFKHSWVTPEVKEICVYNVHSNKVCTYTYCHWKFVVCEYMHKVWVYHINLILISCDVTLSAFSHKNCLIRSRMVIKKLQITLPGFYWYYFSYKNCT